MGEKINVAIIGAGIVGTTLRFGVEYCFLASFNFIKKLKYISFFIWSIFLQTTWSYELSKDKRFNITVYDRNNDVCTELRVLIYRNKLN